MSGYDYRLPKPTQATPEPMENGRQSPHFRLRFATGKQKVRQEARPPAGPAPGEGTLAKFCEPV